MQLAAVLPALALALGLHMMVVQAPLVAARCSAARQEVLRKLRRAVAVGSLAAAPNQYQTVAQEPVQLAGSGH